MNSSPQFNALQRELKGMIGSRCWRVSVGPQTGPAMNLDLGARQVITVKSNQKTHECGEFGLQIGNAAWRVSRGNVILASSLELHEPIKIKNSGAEELEGETLLDIKIDGLRDLHARFSDDTRLDIFGYDSSERSDNYTLSVGNVYNVIKCIGGAFRLCIRDCN